jgi:hypothetical protein
MSASKYSRLHFLLYTSLSFIPTQAGQNLTELSMLKEHKDKKKGILFAE